MKYCSYCGQKCEEADAFCTNCGSKLDVQNENRNTSNTSSIYTEPSNVNPTAVPKKMNIMCIVGFVCSFVLSILGLIFSIVGLCQVKESGEDGKAFAIAGIIISGIKLFLLLIFLLIFWSVYNSIVYNSIFY